MNQEKINTFVLNQLKSGLSTEDIVIQLRTAKWSDTDIEAAFAAARAQLTPNPETLSSSVQPPAPSMITSADMTTLLNDATNPLDQQTENTNVPPDQPATFTALPPHSGRSSFKTGLKLFTQSIRIMRNNPELLRYAVISTAWVLLIVITIAVVAIFDSSKSGVLFRTVENANDSTIEPTLYGFITLALATYTISTVVAFYGVATSSHTLAIFRGEPGVYKDHIGKARKKLPAILVFSLINTVVGYIMNILESRFRLLGWIISKILGALWSLATSFVLPVIADSDDSGTKAISNSISLFKNNWGETITGRVAAGGSVMLLYLLAAIPISIVLSIILISVSGMIGLFIAGVLFILGFLGLAVISSLADSIVTTSLYYYATYKAIPPSYSPELLGDIFNEKKSKK